MKEFLAHHVEELAVAAYGLLAAWLVLEGVIWQRQKLGATAAPGRAGWWEACVALGGVVGRMEKVWRIALFVAGGLAIAGGALLVGLGLVR